MIITIIRQRFFEDAIVDGDVEYHSTWTEEVEVEGVNDAAAVIRGEGLEFAATGNLWAADPDGSQVVDHYTGEREEVTAHFGPEWPEDAIEAVAVITG